MSTFSRIPYRQMGLVLTLVGLVGIAAYSGYEAGLKKERSETLLCSAIQTQNYLSALRGLRGADTDGTLHMLEVSLDAGTIFLDIEAKEADPTMARTAINTLADVKRYRQNHPWASNNAEANTMVNNILSRVQAKP